MVLVVRLETMHCCVLNQRPEPLVVLKIVAWGRDLCKGLGVRVWGGGGGDTHTSDLTTYRQVCIVILKGNIVHWQV